LVNQAENFCRAAQFNNGRESDAVKCLRQIFAHSRLILPDYRTIHGQRIPEVSRLLPASF